MSSVPPAIQARLEDLSRQWLPGDQHTGAFKPLASIPETSRIPRMDRRNWRALIAIAALAFVIVGWMWWQGRAQAELPIADRLVSPASASASALVPGNAADVVVHVVGAVRRPGVLHLAIGSRVADALKAAGGAWSAKAESSVNLARVVVDGEQIVVSATGTATAVAGGKVSLNSASAQQFEELPGVGPVLAQRILDYRTEHGSFRSINELDEVSGIGTALMGQLRTHVQM